LQQNLGITTIVVTHDQREAMTMADTVVVMNKGEIRQAAAPVDVYRRPADTFVADFIGMTNLIDFVADTSGRAVVFDEAVGGFSIAGGQPKGFLSIRPEDLAITPAGKGTFDGKVVFVRDLGGTIETFIEVGGKQLTAVSTPNSRPNVTVGETVGIFLHPDVCVVLNQ
jgi:putative spermidine/putrescine transport system ATP-binding protein